MDRVFLECFDAHVPPPQPSSGIERDRGEPGARIVRNRPTDECALSIQERGLHDVLRIVAVVELALDQAHKSGAMLAVQRLDIGHALQIAACESLQTRPKNPSFEGCPSLGGLWKMTIGPTGRLALGMPRDVRGREAAFPSPEPAICRASLRDKLRVSVRSVGELLAAATEYLRYALPAEAGSAADVG